MYIYGMVFYAYIYIYICTCTQKVIAQTHTQKCVTHHGPKVCFPIAYTRQLAAIVVQGSPTSFGGKGYLVKAFNTLQWQGFRKCRQTLSCWNWTTRIPRTILVGMSWKRSRLVCWGLAQLQRHAQGLSPLVTPACNFSRYHTDQRTEKRTDRQTDGLKHSHKDGRTVKHRGRQTGSRTDGQTCKIT